MILEILGSILHRNATSLKIFHLLQFHLEEFLSPTSTGLPLISTLVDLDMIADTKTTI